MTRAHRDRPSGEPSLCTDNTSPYAHTRALFSRCARSDARCDHTFGSRLDDLFVCLKSRFIIGHVFVGCSFNPFSSYFLSTCHLTDGTDYLTDATDWNQIKPPVQLRSGVDRLAIWPIRPQTQVVRPSSASMSVASTLPDQNHGFPARVRRDDHRFRGPQFTSASRRQQAEFPLC